MAFNVYVGSFTVTTGFGTTQTITGIPFPPTAVIFFGCPAVQSANSFDDDSAANIADFGGSGAHLFFGIQTTEGDTSTERWGCVAKAFDNQTGEQTCVNGNADYPINELGKDGFLYSTRNEGYIDSYTADGFVIQRTNAFDSYAGTSIHYIAFGGDFDVDTWKETVVTGATGDDTISLSVDPKALIFSPTARTASGATSGFSWALGFAGIDADSTITQGGASVQNIDDANPSDLYRYQRNSKAVVLIKQDGSGLQKEATVTAFGTGSADINTSTAGTGTLEVAAFGGTGLAAQVVTITQPTSTGVQTIGGLSVAPLLVLIISVGATASTSLEHAGYGYSLGASDGSRQRVAFAGDTHNAAPSVGVGYSGSDCIFLAATPAATPSGSTVLAKASAQNFDNASFDLNWTAADATQRELIALVIGTDAAPSVSSHNLLTGANHTVQGDDNLIVGNTGTVTGDRNALFALATGSPVASITGDATFKVNADVIELTAPTATLNGSPLGSPALDDLTDVVIGSPLADGDVLTYDTGSSTWGNAPPAGGGTIDGLTDVVIGSPLADGDVLTYDSGSGTWVNAVPATGTTLNGLTDVAIGSPLANGDVLTYDIGSGLWINAAAGEGPYPDFVDPTGQTFAWINQGGATISTVTVQGKPGLHLTSVIGAGNNWRIRKMAAPGTTPYTVTAYLAITHSGVNYNFGGLTFRESSSGKLEAIGWEGPNIIVDRFNSPTSYNSAVGFTSVAAGLPHPMWYRIVDDGANREYYFSNDKLYWVKLYTVARTTFLTADEIGFVAESNNATWGAGVTLLSWEVT